MDPNRFKNALLYYRHLNNETYFDSSTNHFLFITYGYKSLNNKILFFMIFFATLTFWVVKSLLGSNGLVHPVKRRSFFACYRVQRTHLWHKRVLKKKISVTPLMGLINLYTSKERSFFECYRTQRTYVWCIMGVNNKWR